MMDRKYSSLLLVTTALSVLPASAVLADDDPFLTWHVSTSGHDSYPGLFEVMPFRTIERAVSRANDGDTIYVHAGVYRPSGTVDFEGKSLTIFGDVHANGNPATIIEGPADEALFTSSMDDGQAVPLEDASILSDLILRDTMVAIWFDSPIIVTNTVFISNEWDGLLKQGEIIDCSFYDQDRGLIGSSLHVEGCDFLGGIYGLTCTSTCDDRIDAIVRDCRFTGYSRTPLSADGEWSDWCPGYGVLLADLVVTDNDSDGIHASANTTITDCQVESNGGSGIVVTNEFGGTGCRITDSTISDNGRFGILDLGRENYATATLEGMHVRSSLICGNARMQVRGGYYYPDVMDVWKSWNDATLESVGHGFGDYWKGSDLIVRRHCFSPVVGAVIGDSVLDRSVRSPFRR